jgi:hypothetical protein
LRIIKFAVCRQLVCGIIFYAGGLDLRNLARFQPLPAADANNDEGRDAQNVSAILLPDLGQLLAAQFLIDTASLPSSSIIGGFGALAMRSCLQQIVASVRRRHR